MTAGSNVVKITAKSALKNNWLRAIIAGCVYLFSYFACMYSASLLSYAVGETVSNIVFILLSVFLLLPLFLGLIRFFWRMIMGAEDSPITVFHYLGSKELYLKALGLVISLVTRIAGISLLVFIPAIAVWVISNPDIYEAFDVAIPIWSSNLNAIWALLGTVSVFVIISLSVKYYLAPLLIVADDNMDVYEAIHMSKIISKNTHIDFVFLAFSFIGWILMSLFVIPLVFTLPYMMTAYVVHCRFAVADYNLFINSQNQFNFGYFGNYGNEI